MPSVAQKSVETERRSAGRYALPTLEIVIRDERFRAVNWSMSGALIYGICDIVGVRVRGEMGVPGSSERMPFTAIVVRADLEAGNCAICFEEGAAAEAESPARAGAAPIQ